jgi:putative aminopeptidase FrvX
MTYLGLARELTLILLLGGVSSGEAVHYALMKPDIVQGRLDLYKGDDTARGAALTKLFSVAGCSPDNLSEQSVSRRKPPNVICVLPGSTQATILVGAHFDHVPAGDGIVDNWSGASLLPSLFQSLAGSARKHTFVFVGFTGEEDELAGSAFYVKHLPKDQLAKIEAVINLDTLGLGPTEVWVSQSDPSLVNRLVIVAQALKLPVTGMNVEGFGKSDEESFIREKLCTITVHSVTPQTAHVLHHREDNPTAIHFSDYYDTYRLLAVYLAALDIVEPPTTNVCHNKPL